MAWNVPPMPDVPVSGTAMAISWLTGQEARRAANPLTMPLDEFTNWVEQGHRSLGGSSVGAVIGLNAYRSAADVWDGIFAPILTAGETAAQRRRMDRGSYLEPIIAEIYSEQTGRRLEGDGATRVTHPNIYFLHATPDRLIVGPLSEVSTRGVLEIKCLGLRTYRETIDEGIDPSYYAQLQHYLYVLRLDWGSFAIFNAEEWTLHTFDVEVDPPFIEAMVDRITHFWRYHVLTRVRPVLGDETMRPLDVLPPRHLGTEHHVVSTESWVRRGMNLRVLWESRQLTDRAYEQAKADFKNQMLVDGYSKIRIPGVGKFNWVATTTRRMDRERFAREHPDILLESYTVATETSTFNIYPEHR